MSRRTKIALSPATWELATQRVQGGFTPTVGGPSVLPIFQSTTYKYEDLDQVERLFALKEVVPVVCPSQKLHSRAMTWW
jgi:O-acetylhomoserine (thiol)-lyase